MSQYLINFQGIEWILFLCIVSRLHGNEKILLGLMLGIKETKNLEVVKPQDPY